MPPASPGCGASPKGTFLSVCWCDGRDRNLVVFGDPEDLRRGRFSAKRHLKAVQ